jgi:hypothetical protein
MSWTPFNSDYVLASAPISHRDIIQAAIDDEGFGPQLAALIEAIRGEYRNAFANAGNVLDEDPTALPNVSLRHALALVDYEAGRILEAWKPDLSAAIRAEVFLRSIYETKMKIGDAAEDGIPAPSYTPGAPRTSLAYGDES